MIDRRISYAPMMDYTDRHARYFMRLISPHVLLYTEMVVTGAILRGNRQRFLAYHPLEHPLALQLGGSDPQALMQCAKIAEEAGFDEVNLNVGCPSDRVQHGRFGACLMKEPKLVADCVHAMSESVSIPVTVKTRIGVDQQDDPEFLYDFVRTVSSAGCTVFIIHARKAWLSGLSPKENREIPPLCYDRVYALKKQFPHLSIILNGGIKTVSSVQAHLKHVDGVMIGREFYRHPYLLVEIEAALFNTPIKTREEIFLLMQTYIQEEMQKGIYPSTLIRPLFGLYQGQMNARTWRRTLLAKFIS